MVRKGLSVLVSLVALTTASCYSRDVSSKSSRGSEKEHAEHGTGPNGGTIFDLGKFHGEFAVDHKKQEATVYVLGEDAQTPQPVVAEKLDLTIKSPAFTLELKPAPLAGDPQGKSSRFVGKHEKLGKEQEFEGTVIGLIDGKPGEGEFKEQPEKPHGKHAGMPKGIGGTPAERELFLNPGGIYSAADIQANGNIVPSKKFQGISWPHDDNLKPGDKVCPVTANKADPRCNWVVNGKSYEFCCTPCLDKFVKWAKTQPDKIKEPDAYIQK